MAGVVLDDLAHDLVTGVGLDLDVALGGVGRLVVRIGLFRSGLGDRGAGAGVGLVLHELAQPPRGVVPRNLADRGERAQRIEEVLLDQRS